MYAIRSYYESGQQVEQYGPDQSGKDAELGRGPQQQRLGVGNQGTEVGQRPYPHEDQQREDAGLDADIVITSYSIHYTKLYDFPSLRQDLLLHSSTLLRNRATLAGNVVNASPIGDATILLLGAAAQFGIFATLIGAVLLNLLPGFEFTIHRITSYNVCYTKLLRGDVPIKA